MRPRYRAQQLPGRLTRTVGPMQASACGTCSSGISERNGVLSPVPSPPTEPATLQKVADRHVRSGIAPGSLHPSQPGVGRSLPPALPTSHRVRGLRRYISDQHLARLVAETVESTRHYLGHL